MAFGKGFHSNLLHYPLQNRVSFDGKHFDAFIINVSITPQTTDDRRPILVRSKRRQQLADQYVSNSSDLADEERNSLNGENMTNQSAKPKGFDCGLVSFGNVSASESYDRSLNGFFVAAMKSSCFLHARSNLDIKTVKKFSFLRISNARFAYMENLGPGASKYLEPPIKWMIPDISYI